MLTMSMALIGCLSPGPTAVAPPEFTSASPRFPAAPQSSTALQAAPTTPRLPVELQPTVAERRWQYVVLHHSATTAGDVETIDVAHRQQTDSQGRPWLGIGYHFVIGNGHGMADGLVEPTFRWREQLQGAHAGDREHNEAGIGICLIGHFDQQPPTPRQVQATRNLIDQLAQHYQITAERVIPHSDVKATRCPGEQFVLEQVVARPIAERLGRGTSTGNFPSALRRGVPPNVLSYREN